MKDGVGESGLVLALEPENKYPAQYLEREPLHPPRPPLSIPNSRSKTDSW